MSDLFTVAHIAQLHEIQKARLKRGLPGIGPELEELIARLTKGGVAKLIPSKDINIDPWFSEVIRQVQVLWDKGFGREQGIKDLDSYLSTIPEIPNALRADDERFPLLILVDGRVGITAACRLAGLKYAGDDDTLKPYDAAKARRGIRWMRCQDGRRNRNRSVQNCRQSFAPSEVGLDAIEGVAIYVQRPEVIQDNFMDLPNSVDAESRDDVTFLGIGEYGPKLYCLWNDGASSGHGSASRLDT